MLSDSPSLNRSPCWHVVFNLPPPKGKKKCFSPVNERIHKEEPQTFMAIIMLIRSALRCTFNISFERNKSQQLQSISRRRVSRENTTYVESPTAFRAVCVFIYKFYIIRWMPKPFVHLSPPYSQRKNTRLFVTSDYPDCAEAAANTAAASEPCSCLHCCGRGIISLYCASYRWYCVHLLKPPVCKTY